MPAQSSLEVPSDLVNQALAKSRCVAISSSSQAGCIDARASAKTRRVVRMGQNSPSGQCDKHRAGQDTTRQDREAMQRSRAACSRAVWRVQVGCHVMDRYHAWVCTFVSCGAVSCCASCLLLFPMDDNTYAPANTPRQARQLKRC